MSLTLEPSNGPNAIFCRSWSEVVQDLDRRRLTTAAAGQLLGLERRQVFRLLLKASRIEGPTGLISNRRGHRSNRRKPETLRRAVLTIIRQWYWDFGPTLAAEKLREDHGIAVGRETLFVESPIREEPGCGAIARSRPAPSRSAQPASI